MQWPKGQHGKRRSTKHSTEKENKKQQIEQLEAHENWWWTHVLKLGKQCLLH